jgi:hypothetical protein
MKDIAYNEQEADLMCAADTALKKIYDEIKRYDTNAKSSTQFLLDENHIDSSEEIDDSDEEVEVEMTPHRDSTREKHINEKVNFLKDHYDIRVLDRLLENAKEFEVFKLNKFKLTMIRELIKFFNVEYASKMHLQLEIIAAKTRGLEKEIENQLNFA